MADRYPTLEEFWKRLELREVEADLHDALHQRAERVDPPVTRIGTAGAVIAVAARLLPGDVPPEALAAFLDERFDQQLGRADEQPGLLPRADLLRAGFHALDETAGVTEGFAGLARAEQDALLARAECGELQGPKGFESSEWFKRLRDLLLLAFASDPRGMVQMGFPVPSFNPSC